MRAAVVPAVAALVVSLLPASAQSAWCVDATDTDDALTVPPPISATATITLFGGAPTAPGMPAKLAATVAAEAAHMPTKYTLYAGSQESLCRWPRPAPTEPSGVGPESPSYEGDTASIAQICPAESKMPTINAAPARMARTMLLIAGVIVAIF